MDRMTHLRRYPPPASDYLHYRSSLTSKEQALLLKFKIFYEALCDLDMHNPELSQKRLSIWNQFESVLLEPSPLKFDSFIREIRCRKTRQLGLIAKPGDIENNSVKWNKTARSHSQKDKLCEQGQERRMKESKQRLRRGRSEGRPINNGKKVKSDIQQEIEQIKKVLAHGHKFITAQ